MVPEFYVLHGLDQFLTVLAKRLLLAVIVCVLGVLANTTGAYDI